ncbi:MULTISPECIES: GNAT family N-acetyltransferase [unclassified Acinetobacter]|uniref:GNAT family N-acetyltransferase n=1 Tax=unclassified Acinetobacter TaxID=196816 RepID=UPI0035B872F9
MHITFEIPVIADKDKIIQFRNEFAEKYDLLHGANELNAFTDAGLMGWFHYIAMPAGVNLFGYAKVAGSTYIAKINDEIAGIVSIRHQLNDNLLKIGGHVGYSTHPKFEGQGVATAMLKFAVNELNQLGINRVLVTCQQDNIGSAKVIEKCGGILENVIVVKDKAICRYWIGHE